MFLHCPLFYSLKLTKFYCIYAGAEMVPIQIGKIMKFYYLYQLNKSYHSVFQSVRKGLKNKKSKM